MFQINESSNNQLYLKYRNSGPSFCLIFHAAILNFIGLAGVAMNTFTIFTTLKTKTFRGTANYLIALNCFFEVLHQSGHLIFLFITMQKMGLTGNLISMFGAAFDRLIAVLCPNFHNIIDLKYKKIYLFGHTLVCLIYNGFYCHILIEFGKANAGVPTTGNIAEIAPTNTIWQITNITTLVCSLISYSLIGFFIKCNKNVSVKTNNRFLRSLFIIMGITVLGYIINFAILNTFFYGNRFNFDPVTLWQLMVIPGALIAICAAANAPILYINSTDYRNAFKQQLHAIFPRLFDNNQVFSSNNQQMIQSSHMYNNH